MSNRFIALSGAVLLAITASFAASQAPISAQVVESHGSPASEQPASAAPQVPQASIVFEDASDKAGIDFTHSFGSRQLGSLLEGTGAGCAWFDYDNSGFPSLYVANGRPLDDSMLQASDGRRCRDRRELVQPCQQFAGVRNPRGALDLVNVVVGLHAARIDAPHEHPAVGVRKAGSRLGQVPKIVLAHLGPAEQLEIEVLVFLHLTRPAHDVGGGPGQVAIAQR